MQDYSKHNIINFAIENTHMKKLHLKWKIEIQIAMLLNLFS